MVADSGKKIGIVGCEIVCEYSSLIGNPMPLDDSPSINPEDIRSFEIDPKLIKTKNPLLYVQESKPLVESNNKKPIVKT